MTGKGNISGSILITTLWSLIILCILAVSLARGAFSTIMFANYLRNRVLSYYLAKSGIKKAVQKIIDDENKDYDSLNEPWGNISEFYKNIPLGSGFFNVSYLNTNNETYYGAADEEKKININKASLKTISKLIQITSKINRLEANDIAASIIDWRDKDKNLTKGGAENFYYETLTPSYGCKNQALESVEELLFIKGMTNSIFINIKDHITVYGDGAVNINTVNKTVLLALGVELSFITKFIEDRKGMDNIIGTEDDNVLKNVNQIISTLSGRLSLNQKEKNSLSRLISKKYISTLSNNFRIHSKGYIKSEGSGRSIEAVVNRSKDFDIKVLFWQEN